MSFRACWTADEIGVIGVLLVRLEGRGVGGGGGVVSSGHSIFVSLFPLVCLGGR